MELLLIGVVALLVLGPQELLRVLRTTGALLQRCRQTWAALSFAVRRHLDEEDRARYHDRDVPPR